MYVCIQHFHREKKTPLINEMFRKYSHYLLEVNILIFLLNKFSLLVKLATVWVCFRIFKFTYEIGHVPST